MEFKKVERGINMPFNYDNLWKITAEKGINKTTLRDISNITSSSLARLSKNENVSMEVLERLCSVLKCEVNDIVKFVPSSLNNVNIKTVSEEGKYKFIDLFSGIGGFRIAGEENGMNCIFSSEIDKHACEVYEENFGEKPYGDIKHLNPADLPDFEILFAGFPCQPFSYAGRLEGFEDEIRGTLFFDIVRILKEKRPKMFLLENVKGLRSHDKGKTLATILEHLDQLGYTVEWKILNSLDFGVPQSRERWYCVGFDKNISFEFPKPHEERIKLKDIVDKFENNNPSLQLSEFENNRLNHHFKNCELNSEEQIRVEHDNSKYLPHTKKGKYGVFSYLKPDKSLRFHVGDYAKTQIQEAYYCNLNSYTPSIIAARAPKLWDLRRHLSDRECARLQGFPEQFKLSKSSVQAKRQLGNAVTVNVVSEIISKMIHAYEYNKTPDTQLEFLSIN
ncbi:DNA (cytosine-5-)-methyltransferase [Staphylococcus xylosus]|uniref:DNA (cytosine-5-)-methyltransferase n=1 Tax=Staphylococcus xylosus TaxID=1288 RepID=UPI002DBDEF86|nr:DNA (cytosine-5-)-methyltransferase [Staphylococcus xylosus]MEB6299041.1 DNA (cytosine-5-)-methyltransferase [Staphylococcus xylosus]